MSFTIEFAYPFYEGVGANLDTPEKWDIALDGRGYMLDTGHEAFRSGHQTIPLIRQQADNSDEPGESTINPEDLWPRGQSSWHLGAGQEYLDAPDSVRTRFRASLGIDPWEEGKLKVLKDTEQVEANTNTYISLLRVGTYIYWASGLQLNFTTTPSAALTSSNIHNADVPQNVRSITSDGNYVYAAVGSNGLHRTLRGSVAGAEYSALACTLVRYVKGRLMAANGNAIYNVTASGAAPAALLTHPNSDFTWVDFAAGTAVIYAAGYSGDKSLIYRTAVKSDGTALDVPVVAGELPDGEIVRALCGYLGYLVIGTDKGFRVAAQSADGNLTMGPLIETGSAVRAFEPQGRFIWFGWENYDATHTGLGRMDLANLTAPNVPAYATDLMVSGVQGQVSSIITEPAGTVMFTVVGQGFYGEAASAVSEAYLDSGHISYGIPDTKIALRASLKHKALEAGASAGLYISADEGSLVHVGTSSTTGATAPTGTLDVPEMSGQLFEMRVVLTGENTQLERYDLRSFPTSRRGTTILVPVLLHEKVKTANGSDEYINVRDEYDFIESRVGIRRLSSYQELGFSYSVFVEETNFQRHHMTTDRTWWNGTHLLRLKVLGD
jgi:hypothetical protein